MKDLSIAQEYLLCSLNEKGKFPIFGREQPVGFVAAALLDLLENKFVHIQDKKIILDRELDQVHGYLSPIYELTRNAKKKSLNEIAEKYAFGLTDRNMNDLMKSVGDTLVSSGCAEERSQTNLFNRGQKYIVPKKTCVDNIIQRIRAELLEEGAISDETIAMTALLNKGGQLKQYFSKYESEELNKRLREIKDSAPNQMIKQMVDYIDQVTAAIIAVAVMPK